MAGAEAAAPPAVKEKEPSEALKYQTWVLKVSIHCEGCKREVKKVLQNIEGVYTISIDSSQQKVTVTGNVDASTLIKKLQKTGKHAELWPKSDKKEKKNAKSPPGESGKEGKGGENGDSGMKSPAPKSGMESSETPLNGIDPTAGNAGLSSELDNSESGKGGGGKKKKKKGQKGNDITTAVLGDEAAGDSSPTTFYPSMPRQHVYPYAYAYPNPNPYPYSYPYEHQVPVTTPSVYVKYQTAYPSMSYGAPHYVAPPPQYAHPPAYDDTYIDGDESGGCSIM